MKGKLVQVPIRLIDIHSDVKDVVEQLFRRYAENEDLDKLGRLARAYHDFTEALQNLQKATEKLVEVIE